VGLTSGFVLWRFHVAGHRLVRRGWLALPMSRFPSTGTDAEQLPPLALTSPDASSSKAIRFRSLPSLHVRPKPTVVLGSSPGVPQRSPLHRYPRVRPLSVARGSGLPHPNMFRPCRSSRLRRFPPHTVLRVYCTPQPVMGFARFPAEGPTCADSPTFLRAFLSPSKLFPIPAVACHQAPCLLAVVLWNRSSTFLGLEALFRSRVPHRPCCHGWCIELPWGSLDPGFHRSVLPFGDGILSDDPRRHPRG